jgi:hypothetical protein
MTANPVSAPQFDDIASLAEAVADEYCPNGPFDPCPVLDDNEITISYGYYASAFDGMLEHRSQSNLDRVDTADSPRARFTVAHELGHYFIDEHRNALKSGAPPHGSRSEFESSLLVEREADHFASHVLMPTAQFAKVARKNRPGMTGILEITKHFGTSVTASALRYAKAEIVPCVVIKWSPTEFQWMWISTEPFRARLRAVQKNLRALPEDCPTRIALAGAQAPSCGYFEAGTTAACWFPYLGYSDSRNILMKEQAMQLGRFGALTFLFPVESSVA